MLDQRAETLHLPHGPIRVIWQCSTRATRVSLRIDTRRAAVIVTLPRHADRAAGLRLFDQHAEWVRAKLAAIPPALSFAGGVTIPIAGEPHLISHHPDAAATAWLVQPGAGPGEIRAGGDAAGIGRRVTEALRSEAGRRFGRLVAEVCDALALPPAPVTIRDPATRWGSCSPGGTVMFNWRLVMAPPAVQRYAAAHEAAHLRHMNHSRDFWALVAALAPEMDESIPWLKQHGASLMRAGQPCLAPGGQNAFNSRSM